MFSQFEKDLFCSKTFGLGDHIEVELRGATLNFKWENKTCDISLGRTLKNNDFGIVIILPWDDY